MSAKYVAMTNTIDSLRLLKRAEVGAVASNSFSTFGIVFAQSCATFY